METITAVMLGIYIAILTIMIVWTWWQVTAIVEKQTSPRPRIAPPLIRKGIQQHDILRVGEGQVVTIPFAVKAAPSESRGLPPVKVTWRTFAVEQPGFSSMPQSRTFATLAEARAFARKLREAFDLVGDKGRYLAIEDDARRYPEEAE